MGVLALDLKFIALHIGWNFLRPLMLDVVVTDSAVYKQTQRTLSQLHLTWVFRTDNFSRKGENKRFKNHVCMYAGSLLIFRR